MSYYEDEGFEVNSYDDDEELTEGAVEDFGLEEENPEKDG